MKPQLRIVAPWGFYGMGNTGDEGTLCGFARLLAVTGTRARVTAGSGNPRHTARAEPALRYFAAGGVDPRRWWAKLRGTAHAVIGGTPIQDSLGDWPLRDIVPLVRAIERLKVPFAFIGCGVERLERKESRDLVRNELAPRVLSWSVRSERDRARLVEYGVSGDDVVVAADMAWLIDPVSVGGGGDRVERLALDTAHKLIGVNICNENLFFDKDPKSAEALAAALDELISTHDAMVAFVCAESREGPEFDKAASLGILRRMRRADRALVVSNEYFTPRELMAIIGRCSLTISMRYHFCLFSAIQGIPFLAVERSDKVADLCWDLSWAGRLGRRFVDPAEISDHGHRLIADAAALRHQLVSAVGEMRARAVRNKAALESLDSRRRVTLPSS